jgi:hypothetical protein
LKVSRCGGKCNGVDWSGEAGSKALSMELQELMSFGALARRDLQKMQVQLSEMRVQMQSYVSRPQLRLFRGVRLETPATKTSIGTSVALVMLVFMPNASQMLAAYWKPWPYCGMVPGACDQLCIPDC